MKILIDADGCPVVHINYNIKFECLLIFMFKIIQFG